MQRALRMRCSSPPHVSPAFNRPLTVTNLANHVTPLGTIVFGSIVDPRENPNSGKFEWNMGFVVPLADAGSIMEAIEQALIDERARNPRFPATNEKLLLPYRPSMKKLDDGTKEDDPDNLLFSLKRNAQYKTKTGEVRTNSRPAIYDSRGMVVTESVRSIPGGTTGKAVYECYVYDMPGSKGVQLQLRGFQIYEMKANQVELAPIEGGWVSEDADPIAAALAAG